MLILREHKHSEYNVYKHTFHVQINQSQVYTLNYIPFLTFTKQGQYFPYPKSPQSQVLDR